MTTKQQRHKDRMTFKKSGRPKRGGTPAVYQIRSKRVTREKFIAWRNRAPKYGVAP